MCPRMGRPVSDNPKSTRIEIRITPQEKKEMQDFAKKSGHSMLELLRIGIETVKQK